MSVQTAKGLALRLRHFSREFRDARSMVSAESRIEIVRIVNRMSGCDGIPVNFLPLIIQAKVRDLMVDNNLWDLSLFVSLVGYMMPEVVSVTDGEKQRLALYCRAGLIALEWPEVFPDIFISVVDDLTDDEIENLGCNCLSENKFEIFGYYATACDLLAEWIEKHADDDHGDRVDDQAVEPFPNDGLDKDGKAFTWGGRRFDQLTGGMMRVLELLDDERKKGHPNVPSAMIGHRAGVATESGMKSQVFKLNRKNWPPVHPVSEIVIDNGDGTHHLIAPDKVPAKVPGGS